MTESPERCLTERTSKIIYQLDEYEGGQHPNRLISENTDVAS